jgi:hypothetical protein
MVTRDNRQGRDTRDSGDNNVLREGIIAGLIGAAAIALWFAIIDLTQGEMFATPLTLGTSLGSIFLGGQPPGRTGALIGYTLFHFALFAVIGIVLSWVINSSERTPSAFIGFAGLFVAFEVGWIGWTTVLSQSLGQISWLQVFVANLIAAAAMGWYMWRQHPALGERVNRVVAGAPE